MKKKFALICFIFLVSNYAMAQHTTGVNLFNDGWMFHKGDVSNGEKEVIENSNWRQVDLPHDWSIEGPFSNQWASATGYLPAGIGWYRKTLQLNDVDAAKKMFIYFDGVYKNSEVWINEHYLGKRPNGYIPFYYEISPYLKSGKNVIAVKVDHTQFADSRWYPGSGIYRNVYLISKSPVHIPIWGVQFTTPKVSVQQAVAEVNVAVNNTQSSNADVIVTANLSKDDKSISTIKKNLSLGGNSSKEANLSFTIQQPALWSDEDPNLYALTVTVSKDGKKVDEYKQQVGFRTIRFDAQSGFYLNDKNIKLKGVCIHHDAGALGAAVPREVWERRLQKLKEVGCNAIRMSHYPHQDYMYNLCDEMGFLVMDEAFDEWEVGKNKWIEGWNVGTPGQDGYHEHFQEWAERDVRDMILRNRNHPSIIMWSIGNEIDYPNDPYTHEILNTGRNPQIYGKGYMPGHPPASRLGELSKKLVTVVKQTDTTRPVTAALAGVVMSNTTTYPNNLDLVGYNYQEYRYAEDGVNYPNRIIYGSENGKSPEAWMAVDTSKKIFGQFLWTGFDFMGEARSWPVRSSGAGILDLAGFPKPDYYVRQTLWTKKPVVYLVASKLLEGEGERSRRISKPSWNWAAGDSIKVNCITSAEEAELFLNGKSLGKKVKGDSAPQRLTWMVAYEPGELVVKGYTNGKEIGIHQLVTAGKPEVIAATADKKIFQPNRKEVAHIEIELKDKEGNLVYEASNEVTVNIEGPAVLLGFESGDLSSHEDYKSNKRKAYNGKLLAYLQSTGKPGVIQVTISAPELPSKTISLSSKD